MGVVWVWRAWAAASMVSPRRVRWRRRLSPCGTWGGSVKPVYLACDVALEAADDLASGLALGSAARGVVDAALVEAQADHRDAPQGVVGSAVGAAVEPVADPGP